MKDWLAGLAISCLRGASQFLVALALDLPVKAIVILFGASVAKEVLHFLDNNALPTKGLITTGKVGVQQVTNGNATTTANANAAAQAVTPPH